MALYDDVVEKTEAIRSSVASLDGKLDGVRGAVVGLREEIVVLQTQIEAGSPITTEQLTALDSTLGEIASLAGAVDLEASEVLA